jgi:hypothetical protein
MSTEIDELKEQIQEIKASHTSNRLSSFGSIATPIVVAIVGGYFALTGSYKNAEISELGIETTTEIAEKDRWLDHAKFAKELMSEFLNDDPVRAKMALELVSHADANLGSRLTEIVAQSPHSNIKVFATEKMLELREVLIRQLVHPDKDVRWNAAEGLLSHSNDKLLIPDLIDFAKKDPESIKKTGGDKWRIFNVMTVLLDLARGENTIIYENKRVITEFAEWSKVHDPRTKNIAAELLKRLVDKK